MNIFKSFYLTDYIKQSIYALLSSGLFLLLSVNNNLIAQPTLSAPTVSSITNNAATLGGTVDTGTGITEIGTVWKVGSAPAIGDNKLAEGGTSTGSFTHSRTGITPKSQIFYAPYAIDGGGTTIGPDDSFYTLADTPGAIASFTSGAQTSTSIDLTWGASAGAAGYLVYVATGGTAPNPTLTDGAAPTGSPIANQLGTSFTETGLTRYTEYSFTVIPYDWDGSEVTTYSYGSPINLNSQFTSETAPVVSLPTVSSITNTGAILGGSVTDDGGNVLTERGTIWKASSPVTITDNKLAEGNTSGGIFTDTRSSLPPKTQIYFAPYAINAVATTIGPEGSFYTLGNNPGTIASFTSPSLASTSIDLTWGASSNAFGYLVYMNTGSTAPNPTLNDGLAPSGSPVANITGGSVSTTISSLSPISEYSFTVVPYDWDGSETTTYNYGNSYSLTSIFTLCNYPTTQPTGLSFSTIHGDHFDLSWTGGNGDRTLVLLKEGSAVDAVPVDGITYTPNLAFGSGSQLGSGNYVVATSDNGSNVTITNVNSSSSYYVAVFSYNNSTKCYNIVTPPTSSATTPGPQPTSTISNGNGAASISSMQNSFSGAPIVFTFTLTDDPGDANGTEFTQLTINRLITSDDTGDWTNVIASARLSHNGAVSDTYTATPGANSIVFTGISSSNNQLGNIPEGATKIVYLEVYLKTNLGALQPSIDGLNLAFEVSDTDFSIVAGHSAFLPGTTTNSETTLANRNPIEVTATKIVYTTQPSATATATIALAQQPILEARDANNNIDLNFSENIAVTTPDATLNPTSALASFTNGYADFTGSGFNLQSTGSSRIRITTSPSSLVANSSPNTVVSASTTVTEITGGIASSPLSSSSTNNALFGFNLTTTGSSLNFTGGTFTTSSEPDGKILNFQLYRSTDADYSTSGDNSLVAGAVFTTPNANSIVISGISTPVDGTTTNNFFIVAEVEGNVFASTPTIQLSIANTSDLNVNSGALIGTPFAGDVFSFVDVTAPLISSVSSSISTISDSDNGNQVIITITYNEDMSSGTAPTISFPVENPLATLSLSASSNWANATQYQAIYDITDANENISNIDVAVSGGQDLAGNSQLADASNTNIFSIDMQNPTVTGITNTATLIGGRKVVNEAVSPTVSFVITFNENMQGASTPVISFPVEDALASGLTLNSGSWTTANAYTVMYNTADLNAVLNDIDLQVTSANDAFGNVMTTFNQADVFDINTANATATAITISSSPVTDNEVGTETVSITVDFSEPMIDNGTQNPTITFTPNISTEMTEVLASATWPTSQQYVAKYSVVDNDVKIIDIDINVTGGQNTTALNPIALAQSVDAFDLITQSPQIDNVTTLITTGYYKAGGVIDITVRFDQDVVVAGGTPTLTLNSGAVVNFSSMVDTKTLQFSYTVSAGENTPGSDKLTYSTINSLVLNGATIQNSSGIDAINTLPVIGGAGSMSDTEALYVDTTKPTVLALTPADDSFNYIVDGNLIIQFAEDIQTPTSGIISIYDISNVLFAQYDLSLAPTEVSFGSDQITINPATDFLPSTSYYVTVSGNLALDLAGNQFDGFNTTTDWEFVTFGPPNIASIAPEVGTAVCIGSNVVITGTFLTGTTQVTFTGGQVATGADVVVISDTEVRAKAPLNSLTGAIVVTKGAFLSNPLVEVKTDTLAITPQTIKLGPSSGTISAGITATSPVCSSGTITQSTIAITILGGTSNYTINYNRANQAGSINDVFIESSYASTGDGATKGADIAITPLHLNQDNDYTLVSVTDIEGCSAPVLNGTYTVVVNERRIVDAGSDVLGLGEVSYFVGTTGDLPVVINTGDVDFPLTTPPSTTAPSFVWSNPLSSDGTFNNTSLLNPTYTIGLNDIFNNSIDLTLTTTNNLTNCDATTDVLTINLITAATATPEIAGGGNVFCWDGTPNPIVTLNGSVGGGATTGIWERIPDPLDPNDGTYQGFDTGSTPATTSTTLVGSTYRFTDYEEAQNSATLNLTPTDGIGGTAEPITITLNAISSISFINLAASVCDQSIGNYSVTNTSPNSTYTWTITNGTMLTPNAVDSTTVRVLWDQGIGANMVEVFETRTDGCPSATITENVVLNPLPTVSLDPNIPSAYDKSSDRVLLESNQPIVASMDKLSHNYSGNGVIKDSNDSLYYFYPNLASLGINQINYSFTDPIGCTNSTPTGSSGIQFTVFDLADPIIDLSLAPGTPLANDLCVNEAVRRIKLDPTVNANIPSGFKFFGFLGDGISANSQINQEATYNPLVAAGGLEGIKEIFILVIKNNNNLSSVRPFAAKSVDLHLLPTLAPDPIENTICDGDQPIELTRDAVANPGVAEVDFRFALEGDTDPSDDTDPSNFIQKIVDPLGTLPDKYVINPANAGFDQNNYSVDSISFNVSYSYTNGFGCTNTVTRRIDVYQTPPAPAFTFNNVCVIDINNIPTATVLNVATGINTDTGQPETADIEWYNNELGTGQPLTTNASFTPTEAQLVSSSTDFYAFQVSKSSCTSAFAKVTYEKFTNIIIAPVTNCSDGNNIEIDVSGSIGGISKVFWTIENSNGTILLNQEERIKNPSTGNYDFTEMAAPDNYSLTATIESTAGCNSNIITEIIILKSIPVTESSIYIDGLESDNGNWIPENKANGAIWEYGIPTGNLINTSLDGSNVWMTGLNQGYAANTETNLYSACFDISGLERPMIKIGTFYNTTADDGAVIEYTNDTNLATATWSILGELETGDKWYNTQNITSNPGNQLTKQFGWSAETDSAWQESKHILDDVDPSLGNVILRLQFKSGGTNRPEHDGMAIDKVFIGNRTRTVLLENFSSTVQATDTESENEAIDLLVNNTTALAVIEYHPDIDGDDPLSSSPDADARALYYGIKTTPRVAIDGKAEADLLYSDWGNKEYNIRSLNSSPLKIITSVIPNGNALEISSNITAVESVPENFIVHTAIVANQLLATNYPADQMLSGETNFSYVVKKMLPSASGIKYEERLAKGDNITVTNTWSTNEQYAPGTYSIIIFVQDEQSRVVYQTEIIEPTESTVTGIEEELERFGFAAYPNPANTLLTFNIKKPVLEDTKIYVYDQLGQQVFISSILKGRKQLEIRTADWIPGVYYIQTEVGGEPIRKRIMVQH